MTSSQWENNTIECLDKPTIFGHDLPPAQKLWELCMQTYSKADIENSLTETTKKRAQKMLSGGVVQLSKISEAYVCIAKIRLAVQDQTVTIKCNPLEGGRFTIDAFSCDCFNTRSTICSHAYAAIEAFLQRHGPMAAQGAVVSSPPQEGSTEQRRAPHLTYTPQSPPPPFTLFETALCALQNSPTTIYAPLGGRDAELQWVCQIMKKGEGDSYGIFIAIKDKKQDKTTPWPLFKWTEKALILPHRTVHLRSLPDIKALSQFGALHNQTFSSLELARGASAHLQLMELNLGIAFDIDPALRWAVEAPDPTPVVSYKLQQGEVQILAHYQGVDVLPNSPHTYIWGPRCATIMQRRSAKERVLISQCAKIYEMCFGGTPATHSSHASETSPRKLDRYGFGLLEKSLLGSLALLCHKKGIPLTLDGRSLRMGESLKVWVTSQPEGFQVSGEIRFHDMDNFIMPLDKGLQAAVDGFTIVPLPDGTSGLLPGPLCDAFMPLKPPRGLGRKTKGQGFVMLNRAQFAFLAPWLKENFKAALDEPAEKILQSIENLDGVKPAPEPKHFTGTLRLYQKEGVGWLSTMRSLGLGVCLADDMGLGKTIQILAFLQLLKNSSSQGAPHLIVAPRSLTGNWMAETEKFTPHLKVADYNATLRGKEAASMLKYDIIITTYHILRIDLERFQSLEFETVVLDEAQAIKNRDALVSRAVREIKAKHRVAMSGTPIENAITELGSLLDFLNPGLLDLNTPLAALRAERAFDASPQSLLAQLSHCVKPFILRRTKEQVLKELPPKTEEVIYCEMDPAQKALYNKVREELFASVKEQAGSEGMGKSKLSVLNALLRLRQIACHPALISDHQNLASGKFDVLLSYLEELLPGGHKILIFSQFTSVLDLLGKELVERRWPYQRLDGSTRDRMGTVRTFETGDSQIFLLSLRAGGLGLNLTCAAYCFLIDPWWNPAVENQAVDRIHRLGQKKPVFAYRLIAKDTVEEKILELQKRKHTIAESLIKDDSSILKTLNLKDLDFLFSSENSPPPNRPRKRKADTSHTPLLD